MADAAQATQGEAMTDTPSTKRRFWQIHLSTAVLALLVIGVLLGLNLKEKRDEWWSPTSGMLYHGWPYPAVVRPAGFTTAHPDIYRRDYVPEGPYFIVWNEHEFSIFSKRPLWRPWHSWFLIDMAVNLGLVGLVLISSEYLIRRRRKPQR